MTNRIDHSGHNHPATPAARKACRAGVVMVKLSDAEPCSARILDTEVIENSEFLVQYGHPATYTVYTVKLDRSGLVVRVNEKNMIR